MKRFLFSSQKQEQCSRESRLFRKTDQLWFQILVSWPGEPVFTQRWVCLRFFFFPFGPMGNGELSAVGSFGKMPVDKHVCCNVCLFLLFRIVSRAREAVLDAHFLVLASDLGKEKAKQLRSDLNSFDMLRYVETLVSSKLQNRNKKCFMPHIV